MDYLTIEQLAQVVGANPPTVEQREVAMFPPTIDAGGVEVGVPLLVVAGAGSGKTATLSLRAAWLAHAHEVAPQNILGLTFTRKAAGELGERLRRHLARIPGTTPGLSRLLNTPEANTYNAFAQNIISEFGADAGVNPDTKLMGEAATWQLMSETVASWVEELSTDASEETTVDNALSLREDITNQGLTTDEARRRITALREKFTMLEADAGRSYTAPFKEEAAVLDHQLELLDVIDAFNRAKNELGVMDYADQVMAALHIVEHSPHAKRVLRERHQIVFLDEFQDTSVAQMRLLSNLFHDHPVTAVGDPNQAIYGWRGASAASLDDFHPTFTTRPGAEFPVLTLSTAWRNTPAVLTAANAVSVPLGETTEVGVGALQVAPGATGGVTNVVYPHTQAEVLAVLTDHVKQWRSDNPDKTMAILARTNSALQTVGRHLNDAGIGTQMVGGDSLLAHPTIQDLRAALAISRNVGHSTSLMRLLTNLDLGTQDLTALYAAANKGTPKNHQPLLLEAVDATRKGGVKGLTEQGQVRVGGLANQLHALRGLKGSIVAQVEGARQIFHLDAQGAANPLTSDTTNVLDTFTLVAADFQRTVPHPTMKAFLEWLDAADHKEGGIKIGTPNIVAGAVQLLTVHASKGLEWDAVCVVEMEASKFPSYRSRGFRVDKSSELGYGPPPAPQPQSGWWGSAGMLAWPLRNDAAHLPPLEIWDAKEAGGKKMERLREAIGAHLESEERRLAYVAVTRARSNLHLSGSWFSTGSQPRYPSTFLNDVHALTWAGDIAEPPAKEEWEKLATPAAIGVFPRQPGWVRREQTQLADAVNADREAGVTLDPTTAATLDALVEDDRRTRQNLAELDAETILDMVADQRNLSVTEVARMSADPKNTIADLVRPIPMRNGENVKTGTAFHAWIERELKLVGAGTGDPEEEPPTTLTDGDDKTLTEIIDAFELPKGWTPKAVEHQIVATTPQTGYPVKGRVDAVFDTPQGTVLVDWKTRKAPVGFVDAKTARQYATQLELYQQAWKEATGEDAQAQIVFATPGGVQHLPLTKLETLTTDGGPIAA